MKYSARLLLTALLPLLVAPGCAEDTFGEERAILVIRPYEADPLPDYADRIDTRDEGDVVVINLGQVAFYTSRTATFELFNDGTVNLVVESNDFTTDVSGARWLPPRLVVDNQDQKLIPPREGRLLEVAFAPDSEGNAYAEILVSSNALNGDVLVRVEAEGYFQGGAPDIGVAYYEFRPDTQTGPPVITACDSSLDNGLDDNNDGVVDGCKMPSALDVGRVGFGQLTSAILYLVNEASCVPFPGAPDCGTCVLTLQRDPNRSDVGVGFKPGTNPDGYFAFQGNTSTPADIPQQDETCTRTNVVPLVISFNAPEVAGIYTTTIVIESTDPDEPLIEIPVTAQVLNVPVAVAGLRELDPNNTTLPWTDANDIEPLARVYMDGRAKGNANSSHDPRDAANINLINNYAWQVLEYPPDANPQDFNFQGQGTGLFSMEVPLAGHYVVLLTVTNTDGAQSLETDAAKVEFTAVPGVGIHVQLVWDSPTNDQDLHLTNTVVDDRVCNRPNDCFYMNCRAECFSNPSCEPAHWFPGDAAGRGSNPSLDRDDTNGLGPENVNIETPAPGLYRVYVHYYGGVNGFGQSATNNTVRIYINGSQVAEYGRALERENAVWAVADITWLPAGTGSVEPYPSDTMGQFGSLKYMNSCAPPAGWIFQ